ncbi:(2Fe-2S) ferredoxin domain-containing protein [Aneurinibacillus sp. Ricciae_BoGa-3]|uniref:(2Fe-2S) ferredoxin domain-containing protein n=1 Tax=Aneurinibacillus sp. Ricciae_BoGa-3 TaxID=3022697 RepID=UPI002340796D|nr:(2Fe-2S) ferredoxin domain-containing protein [Aneurinibacillus sp. Ricciae_BoGa-3]WCK55644.1 (2Fe-2S) ferredoxin domain-containing protein [Aneurinibacillus sp. Ricciae_BoGa-3]
MTTWNLQGMKHHLLICNGSSCLKRGGEEVTQVIREQIANLDADAFIHTTRTRCNGRCEDACVVIHYPEGIWYKDMTPEIGKQLISSILNGQVVPDSNIIYRYQDGHFLSTSKAAIGISKAKSFQ